MLGANLDVCGWFFSCISMIWLFRKFSQWCGYSGNSPEGAAAPCTSRSCFSSRKILFKAASLLQTYGGCSPQKILLKAASPTSRFMRLFSSKNPPQGCVSHLQIHATVILKWCASHQIALPVFLSFSFPFSQSAPL